MALWLRPLAHNPRVVSSSLSGPKVFVIISIHENGMVVHLCTPVHPAVMGTWNFPGCKFPGHVSLKPAKGPGGTSGAHTQQLRGMVSCEYLARLQELASTGSQCLLSAQASWLRQVCMTELSAAREFAFLCVCVCVLIYFSLRELEFSRNCFIYA